MDPKTHQNAVLQAAMLIRQEKNMPRSMSKALPEMAGYGAFRTAWKGAMAEGCNPEPLRAIVKAAMGGGATGEGAALYAEAEPFMVPEMSHELADGTGMQGAIKAMHEKYLSEDCPTHQIVKSMVHAHTRVTKTGRVVQVKEYQDARKSAMDASRHAHGASEQAMGSGQQAHHVDAAKSHMAAYRAHKDAAEQAPMDVRGDHEELMRHHADASHYHMKADGPKETMEKKAPKPSPSEAPKDTAQQTQSLGEAKKATDNHIKDLESKGYKKTGEHHISDGISVDRDEADHEHHFMEHPDGSKATVYRTYAENKGLHTVGIKHGADMPKGVGSKYAQAPWAGRPVAKAHVAAHTRKVNGKVIQVKDYDNGVQAKQHAKPSAYESVPDDENPKYALQLHHTKHLAEAARGERDLNHHAKAELAARGLDSNGKWVGFDKAEAHHGVKSMGGGNEAHGHFQTMHTKVLSSAARGEVDLNHQARQELASRGVDSNGKWVGFKEAEAHHAQAATSQKTSLPAKAKAVETQSGHVFSKEAREATEKAAASNDVKDHRFAATAHHAAGMGIDRDIIEDPSLSAEQKKAWGAASKDHRNIASQHEQTASALQVAQQAKATESRSGHVFSKEARAATEKAAESGTPQDHAAAAKEHRAAAHGIDRDAREDSSISKEKKESWAAAAAEHRAMASQHEKTARGKARGD